MRRETMSVAKDVTMPMPVADPASPPSADKARVRRLSRGGHQSLTSQFLQFAAVGASNAIVDLGILNLLLAVHPTRSPLTLIIDNTIAVSCAILNSYLWNTRWTFRAEVTHRHGQRALFVAQALLNVAINNLVLLAVAGALPPSLSLSA